MPTSTKSIRIALRIAKVVVLLVPVFMLGWLLNRNFLLGSSVTYSYRPGMSDSPVTVERPTELVACKGADGRTHQCLSGSALHFNVTTPRSVEDVRVRLRLNNVDQPGLTFVAQGTPTVGEIEQMVNSEFIDTLPWSSITDGDLTLWQRNNQFPSVRSFLESPPFNSRVAAVGFPADRFVNVPDYTPTSEPTTLPAPLRGSHSLLVYVGSEDLDLTFAKRDLNLADGADGLVVRVVDPLGVQRLAQTLQDDGDSSSMGKLGPSQPVAVHIPGIGPGIVRIGISTSDDVLLTQFTTRQQYLAFEDKVFLAQMAGIPNQPVSRVSVSVRGESVSVQTSHTAGLQTFTVGRKQYTLKEIKKSVSASVPVGGGTLSLAKGDAFIVTNGLLSVLPTRMVPEPTGISLAPDAVPDPSGFDFVLARYTPTQTYGERTIDETYDAQRLLRSNRRYYFVLEAPGLSARGATVGIEDIRVMFHPSPIRWTTITNAIHAAIDQLRGKP